MDLRLGRHEDVLAGVEVDAVITDPPYGERTHRGASHDVIANAPDGADRALVTYECWTPGDVAAFVRSWSPRCRGWMVALTSHDLAPAWEDAYDEAGRFAFAPVPLVNYCAGPRQMGDGPASWTVWGMVARPRTRARLGSLPGAYVTRTQGGGGGRGKPMDLCRALVRDYSRPGDLVADPCAGWGGFLAAAASMGRRAIGAEVDPEVHAEAMRRLARVQTVDLFDHDRSRQPSLLAEDR